MTPAAFAAGGCGCIFGRKKDAIMVSWNLGKSRLERTVCLDDSRDLAVLAQRIRRRLPKGLKLHKTRGRRQLEMFGEYWMNDSCGLMPIAHHLDLVSLARRLHICMLDLDLD